MALEREPLKIRYENHWMVAVLLATFALSNQANSQPHHEQSIDLYTNPTVRPVYDHTSFLSRLEPKSDICSRDVEPTKVTESGSRIKMLGYALVYMDNQAGASIFGHLGERFIYCLNDQYVDKIYEYFPLEGPIHYELQGGQLKFDELSSARFKTKFGILPQDLSPEYLKSLSQSMLIQINADVAEAYGIQQQIKNRTIYEAWFKTTEEKMYQILLGNEERRQAQNRKMALGEALPGFSFANNCTSDIKRNLVILNPAYLRNKPLLQITPAQVWTHAKKFEVEKLIIYPSQRLFRILKMKEAGKRTLFENLVPFSKTVKKTNGGWMFLTLDTMRPGKLKAAMTPVAGLLNAGTAVIETAVGLAVAPISLVAKIFGFDILSGPQRIKMGLVDLLSSLFETAYVRFRYPISDQWTEEELEVFRGMTQTSVILDFMKVKLSRAVTYLDSSHFDSFLDAPDPVANWGHQ